jgi:hypothetical protein
LTSPEGEKIYLLGIELIPSFQTKPASPKPYSLPVVTHGFAYSCDESLKWTPSLGQPD